MAAPTLADLRQAAYDLFDEGAQNYITPAEMNRYINSGASRLYNWLVSMSEEYVWVEVIGGFGQGTYDFSLPADFMKALKVFLLPRYIPLPRVMPNEWRGAGPYSSLGYLIVGNYLRIAGQPQPDAKVSLWYVPTFQPMVADTDTLTFPYVPGWAEFIVNHAVIRARIKEESDCTDLRAEQAEIKQQILEDMQNRDLGTPRRVVDVERGGIIR